MKEEDLKNVVADGANAETEQGAVNSGAAQDAAEAAKGAEPAADDFTEKLGQQVVELTGDLQRTRADFENYRKQVDAQKAQLMEVTRLDTVKKMLPLLDDIDRAMGAHAELKPLEKNLAKTLKELGLAKMNTAKGVEFNPDLHEAVSMEESEGEKEVIAETLRAGYTYGGAVVRAAMVRVKRG